MIMTGAQGCMPLDILSRCWMIVTGLYAPRYLEWMLDDCNRAVCP